MSHIYKLRPRHSKPKRRRTAKQIAAREIVGVPLPLQPRRPLRALPPDHFLAGRVFVVTGELLRRAIRINK